MLVDSDKVPYYVTVLFAGAGWAVVHTVDRLVESPAIEYKLESKAIAGQSDDREIIASITNLSKKSTFRSVEFLLRVPKDAASVEFLTDRVSQENTTVVTYPPALPGEFETVLDRNSVHFKIPVLAPGNRIDLVARFRGTGQPILLGMPSTDKEDSFALLESSISTSLAKYELRVIWAAIGLWLTICATLIYRGHAPTKPKEDGSRVHGDTGSTNQGGAHTKV